MAKVIRTPIATPGGVEIVYTSSEGQYLARIRVEAINEAAMKVAAEDFLTFLAEQQAEAERPKIALAVANGLRGN